MKNSDMKVIAIILSIALFFTIVTSNAVSVASVVLLALDNGTSNEATQQTAGPAQQQSTQQGTAQQQGTVADPNASADAGNTATNNAGNTATNNAAGTSAIEKDPLGAFQKASKEINQKAVAGYTKKGWQAVEGDLQLSKFGFLSGTLTNLIKGFMTEESAAEEKVNAKGSDDAKNRMPSGDISKSYVKSATATKDGSNFLVTIVIKDQVNPSYADKDGLVKVSKEFLDIKDVQDTVKNDETVSKVVSKLDGTINYQSYTIKAKMNAKGQFIDITHYCVGDIKADLTAVGVGDLSASGALSFNAHYYDFKY
jgi:hypothetical protein